MSKATGIRQSLAWALCILIVAVATRATPAEVAVIAHPSVPVNKLSSAELLDLYTGDVKEWSNGARIVVLDLKPKGRTKDTFYGYLGKSSSRMKSIWMKNMLSGEGQPPQAHDTEQEIVAMVASTPGAIGYVNRSLVSGNVIELAIIPMSDE